MSNPLSRQAAAAGPVRVWLRAEGLAVLAFSLVFYSHLGGRWWIFFALLLAPDLFMLGYLVNARVGASTYNLVHSYVLPVALGTLALGTGQPRLLPLLSIWTAHIGMDRFFG